MSLYDEATKQANTLLKSLESINKEKANALKLLREQTETPSLEALDKTLKHIREEMMNDAEGDVLRPEIKMVITMTHKMAAVLDVPFGEIAALYKKYDIIPPKFKEN